MHYKDEEMIRLSHSNTELDKQILQLSVEVDRLRHYDATSNKSTVMALQQKLQAAKQEIRRLKSTPLNPDDSGSANVTDANDSNDLDTTNHTDLSACSSDHDHHGHNDGHDHHDHHNHDDHHHEHHDNHSHSHEHDHGHDCHADQSNTHTHTHQSPDSTISSSASTIAHNDEHYDTNSVSSTINLATNEAMHKLQARFRRTMNEIADLTEEKQRLEHLVLQLQSETETIGEYIALYQTQRRLLKRREVEKDMQLHRIATDREEMRDKLRQLNELVELLLTQNGVSNARQIMERLNGIGGANVLAGTVIDADRVDEPVAADAQPLTNGDGVDAAIDVTHEEHTTEVVATASLAGAKHETAKKIINLLADIRDKNLKENFTSVPNDIHHCPCCSGKLEVV